MSVEAIYREEIERAVAMDKTQYKGVLGVY